jgi:Kef-type K+ transport system membrane component KefB
MTEIARDMLAASTTLAGLLIVFLGGLVARYEGLDEKQKRIIGPTFRWRGTLAFIGFLAASSSAVMCIISHALSSDLAADVAAVLLGGALVAVIWAAILVYGQLHDLR